MDASVNVRTDGPADAHHLLVLAPGSGQTLDEPLLALLTRSLRDQGVASLRFDFGTTGRGGTSTGAGTGTGRRSDASLRERFRDVIAEHHRPPQRLVLGGFSLGARIACQLAPELDLNAAALVVLSFPFHPKGKPADTAATEGLRRVPVPTLVLQGSRDAFGNREQVRGYRLPSHIHLHWFEDSNHNLQPRRGGEAALEQNIHGGAVAIARFLRAEGLSSPTPAVASRSEAKL